MTLLPDAAVRVLMAGGSLILEPMLSDAMIRCAVAARHGGGHVTFKGKPPLPDTMISVAAAAPGHVTFDLT